MFKINCTLLLVLFSPLLYGQHDYKGIVIDSKTKETLPYVNIGILNKGIGTVSDNEGVFHLNIDTNNFTKNDTLQFSSLGYKTIKIAVPNLKFEYNEYPQIEMKPEALALNEVIVRNKPLHKINDLIGYQNYGERSFGYWKDNIALGGELATKIRVKSGLRKLNYLFFEVFDNPSDSVLIRVNIYKKGKRRTEPSGNLNTSAANILYTIPKKAKFAAIDLTPYEIFVVNDFYISLELLKVYGKKPIGLVLAAANNANTYSLRKLTSMDKWQLIPQAAMGYHLNTTYFSERKFSDTKVRKANKRRATVTGFVFSARRPLSQARIVNISTNEETVSDSKGRYKIPGEKGDYLFISANGMKEMVYLLKDKSMINLNLVRD